VQRVENPSAGTALYAFSTIIGAVISSIYLGVLSDRAAQDRYRIGDCGDGRCDDRFRFGTGAGVDAAV
jgi:hypothetical protein